MRILLTLTAGRPPAGWIAREGEDHEAAFAGWLDLLRLLDAAVSEATRDLPRPQTASSEIGSSD